MARRAVPPSAWREILVFAITEEEHWRDHSRRRGALKQIAANGWKPLPEHPDIAPGHEALMLREHMTELLRADEVQEQPPEFRALLAEGERRAQAVEDAYRAWQKSSDASGFKRLDASLEAVNQNCAACHTKFRDVPLNEKDQQ